MLNDCVASRARGQLGALDDRGSRPHGDQGGIRHAVGGLGGACRGLSAAAPFAGVRLAWDECLLRRFTADLAQRDVAVLTVADAIAWAAALPAGQTRRPVSRATVRLTAIRGFATYPHTLDPAHEIPPRAS